MVSASPGVAPAGSVPASVFVVGSAVRSGAVASSVAASGSGAAGVGCTAGGRIGVRLGRALELASATEPGRLSVGASPGSCTAGGEEAGSELGSRVCGRTTTAVTPLPFCSRS